MRSEEFTKTTFDDGRRSVDFVLVFHRKHRQTEEDGVDKYDRNREIYFRNLQREGVDVEVEEFDHNGYFFVKLHATRTALVKYAELLKWQMPVKQNVVRHNDRVKKKFGSTRRSILFDKSYKEVNLLTTVPMSKYLIHYEYSRSKSFLFDEADPHFFPPAVRIVTIHYLLQRTAFEAEETLNKKRHIGIQRMIHDRIFVDSYPIHDGHFNHPKTKRGLLLRNWGSLRSIFLTQPIDEIKHYFGPQIALYFAWLGLYTSMLVPAAIFGVICLLYGWFYIEQSESVKEICSSTNQFIMCPLCDRKCDYWILEETCFQAKIENLFDNHLTIFFAIFMSLWTTLLLEIWKRYSAHLIHNWGLTNFTKRMEPKRPQYVVCHDELMESSDESVIFNHDSTNCKPLRYCLSYSVSLLGISLVLATTFAVIIYRMSLNTADNLYGEWDSVTYRTFVLPATGAAINLIICYLLNYVYYYIAVFLTEKELHRTQSEYDENLSLKIYLFQFVNYYSSIFYIAFIKGKFIGYPARYNRIFGFRQEECSHAGCMADLTLQLAVIMVGKQLLQTANEMILAHFWVIITKLPLIFKNCCTRNGDSKRQERRQWVLDFNRLNLDFQPRFNEYLEMMIQFGFITLFVVCLPIAPLAALLNNIFEIRLDAKKFLIYYRRPIPKRAKSIGSWYSIMQVISRISVLSNAVIIAFSSNFLTKIVYSLHKAYGFTDKSFVNYTKSQFSTADFELQAVPNDSIYSNVTTCYYKSFRHPPTAENKYEFTYVYWHVLAARLAFIVLFQNLVGIVQIFADWAISDVPMLVKTRIRKEEQLISDFIIEKEKAKVKSKRRRTHSGRNNEEVVELNFETEL